MDRDMHETGIYAFLPQGVEQTEGPTMMRTYRIQVARAANACLKDRVACMYMLEVFSTIVTVIDQLNHINLSPRMVAPSYA